MAYELLTGIVDEITGPEELIIAYRDKRIKFHGNSEHIKAFKAGDSVEFTLSIHITDFALEVKKPRTRA